MSITKRQMYILKAIIDDYILTGVPVGSRTLSKREDIHVSSATIRNDMADLEEGGYLEQPYTSAGRKPSVKAYRLYVDTLMHVSKLSEEDIKFVREYLNYKLNQLESVIDATAKVLSELTNLTSIVLAPQLSRIELKRIQIVRVSEKKVLAIFVFNTGIVKDVLLNIPRDVDVPYLEMLSNILTEKVANLRLPEALMEVRQGMRGEMESHRAFMEKLLDSIVFSIQNKSAKDVVLGGTQNIFNYPEYRDVEKAKNFLSLLETKDTLYDLLTRASDMEFTVKIGTENSIPELKDMSIVTATYNIGGEKIGSFGVIGPTRMDYARIYSILRFVGASINEILVYYLNSNDKT